MSDDAEEWTFAMIDLAGFTALTETHGDEQAADLATSFAAHHLRRATGRSRPSATRCSWQRRTP